MQAPEPTTTGAAASQAADAHGAAGRTAGAAGTTGTARTADADVLVVGAGPAGSTTAAHLARAGLDVLVLEKATFPRPKVCGDGFTPRGMKQIIDLGIDCSEGNGWLHNRGLRVVAGGVSLDLSWPTLANFPDFGAVRPRQDFDELLVRHAEKQGARLREATTVTAAITDERTGRVVGVEGHEGPDKRPVSYRAPLTLACDGVSARVALSLGIAKDDRKPLGVAVRRYYESPRTHDDHLETHLEIWDRSDPEHPRLLPGYGWIFGMGDGTSNVGLGVLATDRKGGSWDYRALLRSWLDGLPEEWGYREDNAVGGIGGAALPMGFNRTPHYRPGLLLVGDAGGMVNPLNGEGIAYAMESATVAARCAVQALARTGDSREAALAAYPREISRALGRYYRFGTVAARLIGNPTVMRVATRHGLPRRSVMQALLNLLANLYDDPTTPHHRKEGEWSDRMLGALTRLTPAL
ncbi:geranylgeranyl reductase family protein [Pseudonocardia sp. RS11V-5]|uniref:geranylgeranyl reductase family protein n=1 Tax=Pseudonocardia terrae TaxID=2905831 RepID=UPI001E2F72AD|nr:geranylgeranyl reductase family protein [Pseudonocardia terrae]MCE3552466.1 geranylgeranyl reductase family protein [Pseudonocardia terrae]